VGKEQTAGVVVFSSSTKIYKIYSRRP
jgi:hypothetical protein